MTREEAIKILNTIPTIGEQVDALEMAIEALEKPKDEAIYDYLMSRDQLLVSKELFRNLQPKSGMWIPLNPGDYGYSAGDFICSCCGKPNHCYKVTDYCCSCGARMKEQELLDIRSGKGLDPIGSSEHGITYEY